MRERERVSGRQVSGKYGFAIVMVRLIIQRRQNDEVEIYLKELSAVDGDLSHQMAVQHYNVPRTKQ